jgi:esterase/lipase superfamily enzyme
VAAECLDPKHPLISNAIRLDGHCSDMKAPGRRWLVAGLYVASLAAVAALSAYLSRNLTGSGPIPDRSSFARRLPGVPDGDARRFNFFYATNRAMDEDNRAFDGDGRRMSDHISTGTFDVRISPRMPIAPWVWHDVDLMKMAGRAELPEDEALSRLRDAVAASPHESLLIIVWGWRDRFHTAALKTAYTAYVLDINTPVLLFDWPGNQGEGPTGYLASRRIAHQSGPPLGQVLARIVHETGAERLWLMGSSLGCQTICDAFAWMMTQPDLADAGPEIDHVVLSAPDVSTREFDERFAAEITTLARHLTAYVASNDQALLTGKWINRSRRLGRPDVAHPEVAEPDGPQLQGAMDLLDLQAKGARNIAVVDATPINRTRNLHHFFTDSPEFFDDLHQRLLQPDNPIGRRLYPIRSEQGATFWLLWDY